MKSVRKTQLATAHSRAAWTALGNDTLNLQAVDFGISGRRSMRFDKVDGAANTKLAAIYAGISVQTYELLIEDTIVWGMYCPDVTNVDYAFLRIGSDASNYCEYQYADSSLNDGSWTLCRKLVGEPSAIGGAGIIESTIGYILAGLAFDGESNTLAGIGFSEAFVARSEFTI